MAKIRIYQLAKELEISNSELISRLTGLGILVKSHSTTLDDWAVELLRSKHNSSIKNKEFVEYNVKPGIIKRVPANRQSNVLTASEKYRAAINRYSERISLNPRDELAYLERGDAHIHLDNPKEALNNYRKALEINPQLIKAYYGMASAHIKLGLNSRAMADVTKAMELEERQVVGEEDQLKKDDIELRSMTISEFEKHLASLIEDDLMEGENINDTLASIGLDIDYLNQDGLTAEDIASLISEYLKESGYLYKILLQIPKLEEAKMYDLWSFLSSLTELSNNK